MNETLRYYLPAPWSDWCLLVSDSRYIREKLSADVALKNGQVVFTDRATLSRPEGRAQWAVQAARDGGPDAAALEAALLALYEPTVASLQERRETRLLAPNPDDPRPRIDVGEQDLSIITPQLWQAVAASNTPPLLYCYGDTPVRLEPAAGEPPRLHELGRDVLRHEVANRVCCYQMIKQGDTFVQITAKPPGDVIADMLASPHPPLPQLSRIVEAPVFARDGAVQTAPGYHPASRTYYHPDGLEVPPVPAQPSADALRKAVGLLLNELLVDFPFATPADKAHAVALLLLPFARDLIVGPTPLHLIESPGPGTGKGLLAETCLRVAFAGPPAPIPETGEDEEWRKRITAALLHGAGAILIDNVNQPLSSGVLAAALTTSTWSDRVLGRSELVSLPQRAIWIATANNPTLSTEVARRSIRIRLDARADRPWQRPPEQFTHPALLSWVTDHRSELVHAALCLIQAWLAAGKPSPEGRSLGSFPNWALVIGGVLHVAGIPSFLDNLDTLYERADVEGAAWREFVGVWWKAFHNNSVLVKELVGLTEHVDGLEIGGKDERGRCMSLSKKLSKQADRVFERYRIEPAGKEHGSARWVLTEVKGN